MDYNIMLKHIIYHCIERECFFGDFQFPIDIQSIENLSYAKYATTSFNIPILCARWIR